jgi:hypothetical protein
MTGMLGVYLTAAELTARGFVVSPTSRSAFGADLLVTDQWCKKTWSVQVKTNRNAAKFWLVNAHSEKLRSDTHIYVFVNLRGSDRPDYRVVPSRTVAENVCREAIKGNIWYSFSPSDTRSHDPTKEGWEIFGDPGAFAEAESDPEISSNSN